MLADWCVGHAQIKIQANGDAYVNFTLALWKTVDQTTPSHYCNDVQGTCDFITCEVTISKTCTGWVCDLSLSATIFKATLVHRDADEIPIRPNPSVCCRLAAKYNPVGINVKSICDNTAISCNQLCKKTNTAYTETQLNWNSHQLLTFSGRPHRSEAQTVTKRHSAQSQLTFLYIIRTKPTGNLLRQEHHRKEDELCSLAQISSSVMAAVFKLVWSYSLLQ